MKKVKAIRFLKTNWTHRQLIDLGQRFPEIAEWVLADYPDRYEATGAPVDASDELCASLKEGASFQFEEGDETYPDMVPAEPLSEAYSLLDPELMSLVMQRINLTREGAAQIRKAFSSEIQKDASNNGRIRMRMTTDREDRMGDTIAIPGWEYDRYMRTNPIILFNHETGAVGDSPPAQGKSLQIDKSKHALDNFIQFHRETRFNQELYSLYAGGYMNTGSVGFWPLETPQERKTSNDRRGLAFTKQELLEFSLVAIPANPDAYQLAMKKGIVRPKAVEYLVSTAMSFATRSNRGKTGESTAAPDIVDDSRERASLAAAFLHLRLRLTESLKGVTK